MSLFRPLTWGVVPAASQAAVVTLGSDLSAPANSAEAHGADSVFWSPGTRMPAYGQVTTISGDLFRSRAGSVIATNGRIHDLMLEVIDGFDEGRRAPNRTG